MAKFNVPKREYAGGNKKMVSWRLPEPLLKELDKLSKDLGWTTTDLVITALDQYVQWEQKQNKK